VRVFENRVLRRISGPKRDEVMGSQRKQHNKEICTPNINRMLKSRMTEWVG
jgi:hypothetical protein